MMTASLAYSIIGKLLIGSFVLLAAEFLRKAWHIRWYMRLLQKRGLPMPPHSLFFGHLGLAASIKKALPSDAHANYLADQVRQRYPDLGPVFYLDFWPFSDPMLIAIDPDVIAQFRSSERLLPRHPGVNKYMYPISESRDLNCLDGDMWKFWRKVLSPGFSAGHVQSLIPVMVEEVTVFRQTLLRRAEAGVMFSFDDHATSLTIDMIGRVAMDTKLNVQCRPNPWISALLHQRQFAQFGIELGIWGNINPMRYFHIWNNRRIMNKHIDRYLDTRYNSTQGTKKSRTIIDLALGCYNLEVSSTTKSEGQLDDVFRKYARSQVIMFIFAGHDTSSTTICYAWLLLSRNPKAMAKIRAEHDMVLGSDPEQAASLLAKNPGLHNQLAYTLAVIKETLRLFPVVSSPRKGIHDFILTDSQGQRFPTEHCLVWALHHGVHRNPAWWPRVDEFLPERFLSDQDRSEVLRPMKNAWRPFEIGPRSCIGIELALTQLKVVLALTLRDFDLKEAFDEWDRVNKSKGVKTVDGERAYQIQLGSAHPADGFPVRISRR